MKKLSLKEYKIFCDTFNEKYDYSTITDMSLLFLNCVTLKEIPLLKTENVTNTESMFYGCMNLTEINLSKVKKTNEMFYNCKKLRKQLSNCNFNVIRNNMKMYDGCVLLEKIKENQEKKLKNKQKKLEIKKENKRKIMEKELTKILKDDLTF